MKSEKKYKARRFSLPAIATLVVFTMLALFGVSNSYAATKVTTIRVLGWAPGTAKFWTDTVAAFQKANPTIKVKLETVPFDKYAEVQGPYITSKSGPDVMANNAGLELFDRRNAYAPLPADVLKAGKE